MTPHTPAVSVLQMNLQHKKIHSAETIFLLTLKLKQIDLERKFKSKNIIYVCIMAFYDITIIQRVMNRYLHILNNNYIYNLLSLI